jgi:glycosidase
MRKSFRWLSIVVLATLISGCGNLTPTPSFSYNIESIDNEDGSVWYEIFIQSFYDSDGDGIGDVNGVTEKLDYLQGLGVSGVWFMPIHPGSSYHLYDVTDYYDIAPKYGNLFDFELYLEEAKARNIQTVLDLVVNHTSNSHPWFREGLLDYASDTCTDPASKCHYYNFSRSRGEGYEPYGGGVYAEARFWSGMPDLNLDNPYVKQEIIDIMEFWFDLGVDGFRLDAVTSFFTGNANKNIEFLSWLGDAAKSIKADSFIVAEGPWSMTSSGLLQYYPARIDSFFNFPVSVTGNRIVDRVRLQQGYDLARVTALFNQNLYAIRPDAIDTPFLSNHDQSRVAGILFVENNDLYHKLLASIYLLMPGKPFMYYGEEIGMKGSGRDENKRLPMIWSETDKTGQTNPATASDYNMTLQVTKGVKDLKEIPNSLWNHYKKVNSVRNKYNQYIENANLTAISIDSRLYSLTYNTSAEELTIITNVTSTEITVSNSGGWTLLEGIYPTLEKGSVSTSDIVIPPFTTLILK